MRLKPKQAQAVADVIKKCEGAVELEAEDKAVRVTNGKKQVLVGGGGKVTEVGA